MPLSNVQFIEHRGNLLLHEHILRSTYSPEGEPTTALIRSNTSIASPVPVAGGAFPITSRTHASDDPSERVSRALRTMRIAAEQADAGKPTVASEPDGQVAAIYKAIARKVAVRVAQKAKDMSLKFPTITVQNT